MNRICFTACREGDRAISEREKSRRVAESGCSLLEVHHFGPREARCDREDVQGTLCACVESSVLS